MSKSSFFLVGALILVLGLSSFGYWQNTQHSDLAYQYIQNANFDLYAHRAVVNTAPETPSFDLDKAIGQADAIFAQDQKLMALARYQQILDTDPGNTEIFLRMGVVHLQEGQLIEAQDYLLQACENKMSVFRLDAQWFLALLHIQDNNLAKAKQLLKPVIEQRGNYFKEAQKLLEVLA